MNPIPGCKDTGGRAKLLGTRGVLFQKRWIPTKRWFLKSANFHENHWVLDIFCCFSGNKRSQAISRSGWPSRIVESSDLRSSCSEPTFTPAPGDDKVWKYADGTAKGTDVGIPFFESSDGSDFFAIFGVTPKKTIIYRWYLSIISVVIG
jgi:hypothetical protein